MFVLTELREEKRSLKQFNGQKRLNNWRLRNRIQTEILGVKLSDLNFYKL